LALRKVVAKGAYFMSGNRIASSTINQEVNDFVIDREVRDLSPKTLRWYRGSLANFATWAEQQGITTTPDVTTSHIRQFLIHLKDEGHNPGGRHTIFCALRAFLNWYKDEYELTDWNPLHKVTAPKRTKEVKQPIALEDFQKLLRACRGSTFYDLRDRAIFMVLLDTGIRKQELADLLYGDVNLVNGEIYIRSGKGRKSRTIFIGAKTRRTLNAYLRTRKGLDEDSPLWVTEDGTLLAYGSIRQVVRRRAEEAGIKEPGMHEFRRAFALSYLRNGGDVVTLQRLMGHASLHMILRYLDLVKDDLKVSHGKFGPVDNL